MERVGVEGDDVGEVSVEAVVVEAVSDDELVRDVESGELAGDFGCSACVFVEEYAGADGGGGLFFDGVADEFEGLARVEDVVDEDDMAVFEVVGECGFDGGAS